MQYPLISEYIRSILHAEDNLDKLSYLRPVFDDHNEPYRSNGAFAVVFKMRDVNTGKCYALKCFTEDQPGRAEAYRRISEELEGMDKRYLIGVRYLENELFVDSACTDDTEFPVLLMDWVDGDTMENYIATNHNNKASMARLCGRFCDMASWLRSQPIAHGDMKPDNVIVKADGGLVLVDYDGMFVPSMKGEKSPTVGTRDYSHPERTPDDFDETIDDFPLASIALSLKAISIDPSLYERFGGSERLLFSQNDYVDLANSEVMKSLTSMFYDKDMKRLISLFLIAHSEKSLSDVSFRLFKTDTQVEIVSTEVTNKEIEKGVEDEYGFKYSRDGKRLLSCLFSCSSNYVIKDGTLAICDGVFWWCENLTSVVIPNSVTSIGERAFRGCVRLRSVIIPESVVELGGGVFSGCESLKDVDVRSPHFLKEGNLLYSKDYKSLYQYFSSPDEKKVQINPKCETIKEYAFYECRRLESVVIPESVTSIGESSFSGCGSLTSVVIPDSVTSIGRKAFEECYSLTSVVIPSSVVELGGGLFLECKKDIEIHSSILIKEGYMLYSKDYKTLYQYFSSPDEKKVQINPKCETIKEYAFSSCKNLTSVVIPESVTSIGSAAFHGCKNLTSVVIPESVTSIGERTFYGCESLTSVVIPSSVTSIDNETFWGCTNLKSVVIPDSVTSFGDGAFHGCESLYSIKIPESVTSIDNETFRGCTNLKSVVIPNSVTSIGERAFLLLILFHPYSNYIYICTFITKYFSISSNPKEFTSTLFNCWIASSRFSEK